ncbi:MAG: N-acetyltransferase [Thermodesulfobacteriota bacterium]
MIRKALVQEVPEIRRLLMEFSFQWNVLPRTLADLYSLVRDYFVYRPDKGPILGIAALHVFWEDLGEIRSLVVVPGSQQQGIGSHLVEKCLEEARALGLKQVFVLTSEGHGKFFARFGFHQISRHKLPEIIWAECAQCFKYPDCDEVPMLLDL